MAHIRLSGVYKKFGSAVAVEDLSFDINEGELLVLLGSSGCGKTTTINLIAGIEEATSGRILFDESDITKWPAHRRNVAMVFQSSLLYPHLSARKNIEMSLYHIRGMSKNEKARKTIEMAMLLGIESLLDKQPYEMSGGQRQRVALAKAIVKNPSVFLLDEPLGSIDAAMREELRVEITNLQKKLGVTMVFVTHDQTEAMTMGDRIAVMCNGKLCQIGKPDRIYNMPYNMFVARFIGSPSMNFLRGVIKKERSEILFQHKGGVFHLPMKYSESLNKLNQSNSAVIGIRPQNIDLVKSKGDDIIGGTIYSIEQLGKETILTINCSDNVRMKTIQSPNFSYKIGETVFFQIQMENVYVFDADTERNIACNGS